MILGGGTIRDEVVAATAVAAVAQNTILRLDSQLLHTFVKIILSLILFLCLETNGRIHFAPLLNKREVNKLKKKNRWREHLNFVLQLQKGQQLKTVTIPQIYVSLLQSLHVNYLKTLVHCPPVIILIKLYHN